MWKDVAGTAGKYQAHPDGILKNAVSDRVLKPTDNGTGYMKVRCGARGMVYVHIIIAETFIDESKRKEHVNHKNGCRRDNRLENLEYMTCRENNIDIVKRGNHRKQILTEDDVRHIRKCRKETGWGKRRIAKMVKKPVGAVEGVIAGRTWKHLE